MHGVPDAVRRLSDSASSRASCVAIGHPAAVPAQPVDDAQEALGGIEAVRGGIGPLALHDPDAQAELLSQFRVVRASRPPAGKGDADLAGARRALEQPPRRVGRLRRERVHVERPPRPRRSRVEFGQELGVEAERRQLHRDVTVDALRREALEGVEVHVGHRARWLVGRRRVADRARQAVRPQPPAHVERLLEPRAGAVCRHASAPQWVQPRQGDDGPPHPARAHARAGCRCRGEPTGGSASRAPLR